MKLILPSMAFLALCMLALPDISASGYVLHIFGNANMDGAIDESDIDQINGIINGTIDSTMLADANYDGKVDEEDIAQVEKIINDSEASLTILDGNTKPVTVRLPVGRAIVEHLDNSEMMMILKRTDKVVGVDLAMSKSEKEFPELVKKTSVSGFSPVKDPDYELAL
ncbi:MAG: ABC transporter substrate-binding protein, partial [Methanothrix sp.]|nr:ABC transporter substrate-binding protein [Methanothrix sp.]